ncbi:MAG: hypothetical protein WBF50_25610, partial [Pseudolabrys sp.]
QRSNNDHFSKQSGMHIVSALHGGQISLARASFIIPRLMRRWDRPFVVFSFVFKMVGEAGLEPAKA